MINQSLDYSRPYTAIIYTRMSDQKQNPRSPEQQEHEVRTLLKRLGLPWQVVKVYSDPAKTGRMVRNRPGYQSMLRDIRTGAQQADLILVDTLERFGRVEDLFAIRKDLREKYGVLILTGDSHFADPSTQQGKALGVLESFRATEHGRILAHNVCRGKKDAVRQKHWPGSQAPLGYRLESIFREEGGRQVLDYSTLVPDPETSGFVTDLFTKAAETGWGGTRLANHFNANWPSLPECLRPLRPSSLIYALDNEIYCGVLIWNRHSTDIAADVRIKAKNPDSEVLRVEDFCVPLVTWEVFEQVQTWRRLRRCRSAPIDEASEGKLLKALVPGMAVNYVLSGLVYCSLCKLRMQPSSTGEYTSKSGAKRRYAKYVCRGYASGSCSNAVKIPEQWLREVVLTTIRRRLFSGL